MNFITKEPINKGWSSDKKYCVTDEIGTRYLLRVSDIAQHDTKRSEFNMMKQVASFGVPMCQPIEFGTCDDGVFCGLACCVCSENKGCVGCQDGGCESHGWCKNYNCCKEKGLNGCWECSEFPCTGCMLDKPRIRAFAEFARRYGVKELEKCLLRNKEKGIVYHYEGQLVGDYDKCQTEEEIIEMIKTGNMLFGLPCYCGHDCSKCVTYIATQTNNDDLRRQAQSFYKESFGLDIPLEKFYCDGGRSKRVFELCKECPFKKCCIERGIDSCSKCSEYPCKEISDYQGKYVNKCNQLENK